MAGLNTGDWLGFHEEGSDPDPDVLAQVVRLDPDGSCALWFGELTIVDYAPGVIQQGIADGSIARRES